MSACAACPCPSGCPGARVHPAPHVYCAWAAKEPRDEVARRHVAARSGCGDDAGHAIPAGHPVSEAVELVGHMRRCPYRSTRGCGCSGARCALRRPDAPPVSYPDCFACVRRYGDDVTAPPARPG